MVVASITLLTVGGAGAAAFLLTREGAGGADFAIRTASAQVLDRAEQVLEKARREAAPPAPNGHRYVRRPEPSTVASGIVAPPVTAPPPAVKAQRAVVIDARSGEILWGLNAEQAAPNASTTKILTALTVLRYSAPGDVVTVDAEATGAGEREINLVPGEQRSVTELLGSMLVGSANDSSVALAKHVGGGSVAAFAQLANGLARRLGARSTNMVTPNGLDAPGHVFSAYDLAVLARVGLADPVFRQWVSTLQYQIPPAPGQQWARVATNKNRLLKIYPGASGVKTGQTNPAGNCLVGAAQRDGREFIAVSLHSGDPTGDDVALLDWAFANYQSLNPVRAGQRFRTGGGETVRASAPLWVSVPLASSGGVRVVATPSRIEARYDGRLVGSVPTA